MSLAVRQHPSRQATTTKPSTDYRTETRVHAEKLKDLLSAFELLQVKAKESFSVGLRLQESDYSFGEDVLPATSVEFTKGESGESFYYATVIGSSWLLQARDTPKREPRTSPISGNFAVGYGTSPVVVEPKRSEFLVRGKVVTPDEAREAIESSFFACYKRYISPRHLMYS